MRDLHDEYCAAFPCEEHGDPNEYPANGADEIKPVVVIPLDQWRRLVSLIYLCGGKGDRNVDEIRAIIASVEVENG